MSNKVLDDALKEGKDHLARVLEGIRAGEGTFDNGEGDREPLEDAFLDVNNDRIAIYQGNPDLYIELFVDESRVVRGLFKGTMGSSEIFEGIKDDDLEDLLQYLRANRDVYMEGN